MAPTTVNVVVKVENIEETTTSSSSLSSPNPIVDPVVDSTTLKVSCDPTPMEYKTRKIIDFRNKVYVAPLTTVGNLPFRRIMKKFTADITCGEMALCLNLLQGQASEWALLKRHVEEDVFGIQLAAGYPDLFIHTAEVLEKENVQVNFVDLNLGCPLDMMCDKGAGARLMQRDSVLRETLEGMTHTLSCPVTIKMRTGWEEKNPFAHKLVHKIHSWGMDGIGAIMVCCF
jgi:tRNA-dihydrouridine synthase 3